MALVVGKSEDAAKMAELITVTKNAIDESLGKLKKYSNDLHGVWNNANSGMIDDAVNSVEKAMRDADGEFEALSKSWQEFADYLRDIGH